MKKYNTFLLETKELWSGTTPIENSEIQNIIDKNCKNFSWDDTAILRSMGIPRQSYVIDPTQVNRKSLMNKNFYTLIMDNSKKWEKYPKRSKSLICSLGYKYWSGVFYRVIPFDNSKWGLCNRQDIWSDFIESKIKYEISVERIPNLIDYVYSKLKTRKFDLNDENWTKFKTQMNCFQKEVKRLKPVDLLFVKSLIKDTFGTSICDNIENENLLNILDDYFDPKENNIQLLDYKELINVEEKKARFDHGGRECWTDSTCLLVPINILDEKYKLIYENIQ